MTDADVLYQEDGVSLRWLALPPLVALAALGTEAAIGGTVHWLAWPVVAVLAELLLGVQLLGGRTHVSVALTREALRCGVESVPLARIAEILPGYVPDDVRRKRGEPDPEAPPWTTAPTMGKLHGIPRRRYAVGLALTDGSVVQAWAKNDYALRDVLAPLLAH